VDRGYEAEIRKRLDQRRREHSTEEKNPPSTGSTAPS
jgi:hypothetical protein